MFAYFALLDGARGVLFWLAVAVAGVCLIDWLIRTRRISAFSGVARLFRRYVDPLLAPIERRVVRSGGLPSSAPWWALAVVVVGGILLLQALHILGGVLMQGAQAASDPSLLPQVLLSWAIRLLKIAIIVRVISSWISISPFSRWIRWSYVLTEWFLGPLRRVIPPIGMIDISPLVAYFALWIIQGALGV